MILIFCAVLVVLVLAVQQYFMIHSLDGVVEKRYFNELIVDPEETFYLVIELENRRKRFIPYIKIEQDLPEGMDVVRELLGEKFLKDGKQIAYSTWMKPLEKVDLRIPVRASARGRYILPDMLMSGGDFLGLHTIERTYLHFDEVVVAPKEVSEYSVENVLGGFLGEVSVRRYLYEDPVLTVGYREYTGQEPMKMISWTQSAKGQGLMVRQPDYTVNPMIAVLLNLDADKECDSEWNEECFRIARNVCAELENRGMHYIFSTNALLAGSLKEYADIDEGLGQHHFYKVLEYLGRGTYAVSMSSQQFLENVARKDSVSRGYIVISPDESVYECAELKKMQACVIVAKQMGENA